MLIALYKPFDVLSQFTQEQPHHRTLAEFQFPKEVYPIGRLDRDSEGLLLLSDESAWTDRLLNPKRSHPRTYWVQVEGEVDDRAIKQLRAGVDIKGHRTLPCGARRLSTEGDPAAQLPPRDPPIRYRASIPTRWLELTLTEGRNRQVRRMTAAVGYPTLRLVRVAIGGLTLADLALRPGQWMALTAAQSALVQRR